MLHLIAVSSYILYNKQDKKMAKILVTCGHNHHPNRTASVVALSFSSSWPPGPDWPLFSCSYRGSGWNCCCSHCCSDAEMFCCSWSSPTVCCCSSHHAPLASSPACRLSFLSTSSQLWMWRASWRWWTGMTFWRRARTLWGPWPSSWRPFWGGLRHRTTLLFLAH